MDERVLVAIGSSDGGIEAMKSFFDCTPHGQATYIILRHIPFTHHTMLDKILQGYSKLKIKEAENDVLIEKDIVYMASGSMYMTVNDDRLFLHKRNQQNLFPNWSIDVFLQSLAQEKGRKSIAVILSGNGADGSKGCAHIKKAGGIVIVQEPSSCKRKSMPENVIKEGVTDYILIPADMPPIVLKHVEIMLKKH